MRARVLLVLILGAAPAWAQSGRRGAASGRVPRSAAAQNVDHCWRAWWERNRTDLVGFRHVFHNAGTITGKNNPDEKPDPLGGYRPAVLSTLRAIAYGRSDRDVRRAAVLAIGRMGTPEDAHRILEILGRSHEPDEIRDAAALALGMLPAAADTKTRDATRTRLVALLSRPERLPARARQLAIIAAGLRARHDGVLSMRLAEWTVKGVKRRDEAAALAFAAGLAGDRIFLPELLRGVGNSQFARRPLPDVARSHVVLALGRLGDPLAARALVKALQDDGPHSRRSAALALGRLLRLGQLTGKAAVTPVEKALVKVLRKSRDPVLRGYCALALGGARRPAGIAELRRALSNERRADMRPWAALGLALAARDRKSDEADLIRRGLRGRLSTVRQHDLHAALCIAVGLAGADDAREDLLRRVRRASLPVSVRGAAAQGFGLLRKAPAHLQTQLARAMGQAPDDLVGDVALALGMLGRRSIMPTLLARLKAATSRIDQRRLLLALGHLGHHRAAAPLLEMIENRHLKPALRKLAATALGLMGDDREQDVLFGLEADFNYLATTTATRAMLDAY